MPPARSWEEQGRLDERFMDMAINMARRGLGTTAPNPSVGAVVVDDDGVILGRGWTRPGGRPHAEVVALGRAGDKAWGATLYVTLEPCSHFGKSPPCADAVVRAGIRRVVVALTDPYEEVAGNGLARLAKAGIEVIEHVGADAAHWVTLGHLTRVREGRPFVQLKLAVSKDGRIAPGTGKPVWVTGAEARARGHLARAMADAILTGSGTIEADDPRLDCRLPGLADHSPLRVVMDTRLRMRPTAAMLAPDGGAAPVLVFHASPQKSDAIADLARAGAEPVALGRGDDGHLHPAAVLHDLARRGITRLLVEAGPRLSRAFVDAGLVDEVLLFEGGTELGDGGLRPFGDQDVGYLLAANDFGLYDERRVGTDKMLVYRCKNA